jgi:hypothetical protein
MKPILGFAAPVGTANPKIGFLKVSPLASLSKNPIFSWGARIACATAFWLLYLNMSTYLLSRIIDN